MNFGLRNAKTLFYTGALVLVSYSAMAQQPSEYTLKLTPAQLDTIGEGLGFMPFNKAAPLINALREQVMAQQPKPSGGDPNALSKPAQPLNEGGK